jgi:glycosyltransferase involved in cell wall biosynthesis
MKVAFLTVGNPGRLTGGYLYHARVFELLRQSGDIIDQIVVTPDASLAGQHAAALTINDLNDRVLDADVVVIDALAVVACRPAIGAWKAARPLVAMVHELPSVAGANVVEDVVDAERSLLTADLVITVSLHGAEILRERGVSAERLRIVAPGCDRIEGLITRHRQGAGQLRAMCVAQWIPRKGIDTLVRAWGEMDHFDATLELIGETDADPEYAAEVRTAIARSPRSIVVRGIVNDEELACAYATADLFVLPSRYEGYGMVYAEALRHGLPVVACDTGPVPELVGPDAGMFVPPSDVTALAGALDRVLTDDGLRQRMSAAAIQRGRELPTWAETAAGFRAALADAIELRR